MKIGMIILGPPIVGGAEIRYANLYTCLRINDNNVFLFINRKRHEILIKAGALKENDENTFVAEYFGDNQEVYDNNIERVINRKTREKSLFVKIRESISIHIKYSLTFLKILRWQRKNDISFLFAVFQGVYAITPYFYQRKIKTAFSYNDSEFNLLESSKLNWFLSYKTGLNRANIVDLLSEKIKTGLIDRGFSLEERGYVSPCSFINYEKFKPVVQKENIVSFCGRLIPYKNPLLFVDAINIVVKEIHNYRFVILGKGILYKEIKQKIEKLNLVEFVTVEHEDQPEKILSKSKIFVSLQETNNYPSQSLIEAMACENAVIATDVGETRNIVNSDTGILINKSEKELADALLYMMKNDKVTYLKGRNAGKFVREHHNIEIFKKYFYKILDE